jgi:hypothetical protein
MISVLFFVAIIILLVMFTEMDKWLLSFFLVAGLLAKIGIGNSMIGLIVIAGIFKVTHDIFKKR